MKTLQETLEDIQNSINKIEDSEARAKAQEKFDKMPKDPSMWKPDSSYFSGIKFDMNANVSPEEIEQYYVTEKVKKFKKYFDMDSCEIRVKHNKNTNENTYEFWAKKSMDNYFGPDAKGEYDSEYCFGSIDSAEIALEVGYKCVEITQVAQKTGELESVRKEFYVNSQGSVIPDTYFTASEISNSQQDRFSYTEDHSSDLKQNVVIQESSHKSGFSNRTTSVETRIFDGKVVQIDGTKERQQENNKIKTTKVSAKRTSQNELEITRKSTETEVVNEVVEKCELQEGESVDLSKRGTAVESQVSYEGGLAMMQE